VLIALPVLALILALFLRAPARPDHDQNPAEPASV
jgi:hypothetical protein